MVVGDIQLILANLEHNMAGHRTIKTIPTAEATLQYKLRKQIAYDTWYSQAVSHPSTNQARRCLTSVIGREPVYST